MNDKQKDTDENQETWTQRLARYREDGILAASKLWQKDPVGAYQLWERDRKRELPQNLPECDRKKIEGILMELQRCIEEEPYKINVNDPRLSKSEHDDIRARQKASFHDFACMNLTFTLACDDGKPPDWPTVNKLLYDLEKSFDPSFYDTGVGQMTGASQADIQNKVDVILATRQAKLARALWECDSGLAQRYAEVLRTTEKPAGLSDVEKRTAFLQEIALRETELQKKTTKIRKNLHAKRAKAGRGKRKVQDLGDRAKIKAAFIKKRKTYETDHYAAVTVAKLWEGTYPGLNADHVKRIAGVKK